MSSSYGMVVAIGSIGALFIVGGCSYKCIRWYKSKGFKYKVKGVKEWIERLRLEAIKVILPKGHNIEIIDEEKGKEGGGENMSYRRKKMTFNERTSRVVAIRGDKGSQGSIISMIKVEEEGKGEEVEEENDDGTVGVQSRLLEGTSTAWQSMLQRRLMDDAMNVVKAREGERKAKAILDDIRLKWDELLNRCCSSSLDSSAAYCSTLPNKGDICGIIPEGGVEEAFILCQVEEVDDKQQGCLMVALGDEVRREAWVHIEGLCQLPTPIKAVARAILRDMEKASDDLKAQVSMTEEAMGKAASAQESFIAALEEEQQKKREQEEDEGIIVQSSIEAWHQQQEQMAIGGGGGGTLDYWHPSLPPLPPTLPKELGEDDIQYSEVEGVDNDIIRGKNGMEYPSIHSSEARHILGEPVGNIEMPSVKENKPKEDEDKGVPTGMPDLGLLKSWGTGNVNEADDAEGGKKRRSGYRRGEVSRPTVMVREKIVHSNEIKGDSYNDKYYDNIKEDYDRIDNSKIRQQEKRKEEEKKKEEADRWVEYAEAQRAYYQQWEEYMRQRQEQYRKVQEQYYTMMPPGSMPFNIQQKRSLVRTPSTAFPAPPDIIAEYMAPPREGDDDWCNKASYNMKVEVLKGMQGSLFAGEGITNRKTAFKQLTMRWHPDKNPDNTQVAKKVFQFLQVLKPWYLTEDTSTISAEAAIATAVHQQMGSSPPGCIDCVVVVVVVNIIVYYIMLPPSSPSSSSPIPLVGELVSPLTKIPRLSSGAAALPPPYSSSSKRVALMSEKQKKRRSSVSSLSSDGDLSMLASPIAYIPTRRGLDKRLDEDDISCSGYTSASSLYDDNRRIGGEKRMSSRGGGGGMVEKENLRAQANECIDLSKRLAVEKERREKAESLVRQLKGQMREFKGSKMSADEKDKRIDKLLRRLSLLAAELEESKVHIKEVNTVHENTKAEVNEIKQASVKERAQHAQAMADLRHASAKKITELAEEKRRLEDAVAGEEGRKIELSKYRERMVAMEIVIESLTEEGKEREKDNEELMEKIEGMRGQLDALERIKEHEIEDVKSKEAKRTRDLLERIEYIEKELKDSRIQHKKHEDNVKVDRDKFNEVKEELERVNAEAISLRHSMEVAERAKQAVEERYEKLKVAEAKRLGEMSSLRLELVEVREALVIAKTRADSLAREIEERADDDNDNDDAIPSIELIINEEDEVAIITKDHIESSSPPPPHTYRAFDSPAATAADVYSTPGGLVGSSSVKRRRRRLRRVSAPLLDAATLSHQPHARMGLVEDLKGQVSNLTTQLIESIGKLRRSEEELDKINVMFKSMEIELNEEKDKVEDMKAEVNARAREILISSGRAAVAESMLREIGEERQREKLTLLSEIASLRSSLLQNEATAARTAASVKAGLQEANEKVHMLETRLSMQQNSISAMSEQCNRWRIQAEQVESQLIGRELEATSLRASLEEAKARAIELSDDLATAGDSLVNMEANTLDLQFKLSYYESLYTQNEAAVIVAKACVGGVTRAMTIESQRREANLISLSEAKVCKATQHAEELRGVLKATENERKDLEKALIILRREAEERELLVAEKIAKLEEMNKDLKVKMKTVEDHLVEAQERLINNDTEIEILKTTGLSAEQRQSLEKEIEEANKTMRDTLDDLSSTRADLETATKEVTRCHKIIEHFDMEVINAGGHDRSSGGTGSHLSQSKRVSYVQHLRIELNNLYEENKRLRNERQNLETQLLMGARRPSTAPARPSPTTNSSATPRRTPCKGPVPPRTPKTPMGMAAAELARRKTFTSRKFSSTVQQPFYGKREAEEIKLNERQRQRLLSERVVLLGRIRGVLEKSNASRESLRTLLESIHDSLASRDGGEMDSQVIHQTKL